VVTSASAGNPDFFTNKFTASIGAQINGILDANGNIDATGYFITASQANITSGTIFSTISDPPNPQLGTVQMWAKKVSNRSMLKYQGPSGRDIVMQPALFGNNIVIIGPGAGPSKVGYMGLTTVGTAVGVSGAAAITNVGDVPNEFLGYMADLTNAATSASTALVQTINRQWYPQGTTINWANGLFFNTRVYFPDTSASYSTGVSSCCRFFAGMGSVQFNYPVSTGTSGSHLWATQTPTGSWMGFAYSANPVDANQQGGAGTANTFKFVVATGTTQSFTDTGMIFNTASVYDMYAFLPVSASGFSGSLGWRIDAFHPKSSSAVSVEGGSTLYPSPSMSLFAGIALGMHGSAPSATDVRFQRIYVESDR